MRRHVWRKYCSDWRFLLPLVWLSCGPCVLPGWGQETTPFPNTYQLKYPSADRFCPPIRSAFSEVNRRFRIVNGRRVPQRTNAGYGERAVGAASQSYLRFVGAALGWQQVGEPVYAVANGIVRVSECNLRDPQKADYSDDVPSSIVPWGNLIVIEHQLKQSTEYFVTIYGHLAADRRVTAGEVVQAGQRIGSIGRKDPAVNGGYEPHLHFGVRRGRRAEIGMTLLRIRVDNQLIPVKITSLGEDRIGVAGSEQLADGFQVVVDEHVYPTTRQNGRLSLPAAVLWRFQSPERPVVSHAPTLEGWYEPMGFLREHHADTNPAPYQDTPADQ